MPWFAPLLALGGGWLANKIFGGSKPEPPDLSFYEGWGKYPTEAVSGMQSAVRGEVGDWLGEQMRQYKIGAVGRGWNPETSSGYTEYGDRASGIASKNLASALANIQQWGAQQENLGRLTGLGAYNQAYQNWLQGTQQGSSDFLSAMIQMLGQSLG
jgi:hypothetical protein